MKKYFAELVGTFLLVLCGTGAIVINDDGWLIGNFGIAVAFGGIVTLMIYAFGKISGAHINPAVTIGFLYTKDINAKDSLIYIVVQIIGALLASVLLLSLFPVHETLGTTLPKDNWTTAFILEFLLTFFLMYVILFFGKNEKRKQYTALAVGATVGLEAYFAGPYTGASMNPARSIGPAIVSGHIEHLWVYIVSTILGAVLATIVWKFFKK